MRSALLALTVMALSSCHQITIVNGKNISPKLSRVNDRLYSSIIGDIVKVDKPIEVDWACPTGWSEIYVYESVFDWLLSMAAIGIYAGHDVTVRCDAQGIQRGGDPETFTPTSPPTL
jgi:hypothetical protein